MLRRPRTISIGTKLMIVLTALVCLAFFASTYMVDRFTVDMLEKKLQESLVSKVRLVKDMIETYDKSLRQESDKFADVFMSNYPEKMSIARGTKLRIGSVDTQVLKAGNSVQNLNFERIDRFTSITGAVATLFVRDKDDFVRIATSLKKQDGTRAIGTFLGREHPGYQRLIHGESFTGKARLFEKDYMTTYVPIKDDAGAVIGIFFIGLDFTDSLKFLKEKIRSLKVGKSGYIFVLDAGKGATRGDLLVHPFKEGQNMLYSKAADGQEIVKEMIGKANGLLKYVWLNEEAGETRPREKIVVYNSYGNWDWIIGGGLYTDELLAEVASVRNYLLGVTAVTVIILMASIYFLAQRLIAAPMKRIVTFVTSIADGDLTRRLNIGSKDEFSVLADSFNRMTQSLSEAQEKLLHREKLALLGQIAGNMGNELRNPLSVMNNAVYFLKTSTPAAGGPVEEYLDIINKEIENAQRIITDLLDFCQTINPRPEATPTGDLVRQSIGMCRIPPHIDVKSDVSGILPPVNIDPVQIEKVLRNLIINAVQAMPSGGVLRISARNGTRGRGSGVGKEKPVPALRSPAVAQAFVEIRVEDSGVGIAAENVEKLFLPLFTTKSRGMGLGLPIARQFAEANGGGIAVESHLGRGTTFIVTLPVSGVCDV